MKVRHINAPASTHDAQPEREPRGKSPLNRSLERGLQVLSCFKPGLGALSNNDLVERTGLPKATVSRLAQTLVHSGFLRHDERDGSYRLAYAILSLAHSVMLDSGIAQEIAPLMRELALAHRVNVGLSVPDGMDMVYLHIEHGDPSRITRRIEPGHRKPIELNAVGRAYLAMMDEARRAEKVASLRARQHADWIAIAAEIDAAAQAYRSCGYCSVLWGHGTRSIALPMAIQEEAYVLNISFSVKAVSDARIGDTLVPAFLAQGALIAQRLAAR